MLRAVWYSDFLRIFLEIKLCGGLFFMEKSRILNWLILSLKSQILLDIFQRG